MSETSSDGSAEFDWDGLVAAAREAMAHAYAPYSHFPVGAAARVDDGRRRVDLVHAHDRLGPVPQLGGVGRRDAQQLGDDEHRQRLGVPGDQVELAVHVLEQGRRELAHPRTQPLDVAAVERRRDRAPQPGVLGRLVLHHLVAVEEVERLQEGRRLAVAPDSPEPAIAEYGAGRSMVERQEAL
jgi:hypothetical protein